MEGTRKVGEVMEILGESILLGPLRVSRIILYDMIYKNGKKKKKSLSFLVSIQCWGPSKAAKTVQTFIWRIHMTLTVGPAQHSYDELI